MNRLNLNVPINSTGYGIVGYNLWQTLNTKLDLILWPMQDRVDPPTQIDDITVSQIKLDWGRQASFDPDIPCLKVWHENRLAERIGRGQYFVFPFFEVNKFDITRRTHLDSADEILVASQWAKDIVIRELDIDKRSAMAECVHVVPCGVDRKIFNESCNQHNLEKCVFFNCGKWEMRKGHDVLHDAFKDAFSGGEDVELIMMNENPFLTPLERTEWESLYSGDDRIKLINRVQFQEEVAAIMGRTYCGVFPSRAEGWNLEALEMMAMGKQIIITDYSAHTEFCNESNAYLIHIDNEEPMYDGKWFTKDCGTWASLEGEPYYQLVEHLRTVYKKWEDSPTVLNKDGILTSIDLSWNKMADQVSSIIF